MKTFNLVSAVLGATVIATAAVQLAAPDSGGASIWRIAAAWVLGAVVWVVVFSLVRDGVRGTLSGLTRRR